MSQVKILLPREDGPLARGLRKIGFKVDCVPLQHREVLTAANTMPGADWVAITSVRTIETLALLGWPLPDDARIAAVGPGTRELLERSGCRVDLAPKEKAGIGALLEMWPAGHGRVVIPGSALMRQPFPDGLRALGYQVEQLPIYTMQLLEHAPEAAFEAWHRREYAAAVLTSGSMAMAVGKLLGWEVAPSLVTVGDSAAGVLQKCAIDPVACGQLQDPESVAELLASAGLAP